MIEGVARAGNGFAQSVGEEERLDEKVVRMLRSALTPDYGPLTIEIQYQKHNEEQDDFVMVERVSDSLRVLEINEDEWPEAQLVEKSDGFTETTFTRGKGIETPVADSQDRHDHRPAVPAPNLMQTPQNIPPLYPSSRTHVYVLMSPNAAQGIIKSIVLKGSSATNPFALEVPVEVLSKHGEMIHQLSAKKAITELEEGRGWLEQAKDEKGVLMKATQSGCFQSMVEREAVRLGIQFQIAGKFTSFVATETAPQTPGKTVTRATDIIEGADLSGPNFSAQLPEFGAGALQSVGPGQFGALQSVGPGRFGASAFGQPVRSGAPTGGGLFSSSGPYMPIPSTPAAGDARFCNTAAPATRGLFGVSTPEPRRNQYASTALPKRKAALPLAVRGPSAPTGEERDAEAGKMDPLQKIIGLQTFDGHWNLDTRLLEVIGLSAEHQAPHEMNPTVWATMLAITFLEGSIPGEREAWVMVVEKARGWLNQMEEGQDGGMEKWTLAKQLVTGANSRDRWAGTSLW